MLIISAVTVANAAYTVCKRTLSKQIVKYINSMSVKSIQVRTSFLPPRIVTISKYGTASEIFGCKWPAVMAVVTLTFGGILCAIARTITWLTDLGVLQGIGAGGLIQVQIILSQIITRESERCI